MRNTERSRVKIPVPAILLAIIVAIAEFIAIFSWEYTTGNKHGDMLGSIIYASSTPIASILGILCIGYGLAKSRQDHALIRKQPAILYGLACFCYILYNGIFLLSVNNLIPDIIPISALIICWLAIMALILLASKYARQQRMKDSQL